MADAILYGITADVLKTLGSIRIREIASAWGFEASLNKLEHTIDTLKNVLLDAENGQTDGHAVRGWLEKLTSVVYAADNLFDKFATVASQRQLQGGNKFKRELRTFFSSSNQIAFAFSIARKIKTIRQELNAIVEDGQKFDFIRRCHEQGRAMNKRRDQTYSFVHAEDVIGRDDEKKEILDMLLTSTSTESEVLSVISIVGIGGMGKTTLTKLIYNDPLVEKDFELRLWVCVSDSFEIQELTEKIIKSATGIETQRLDMEQLQIQLRKLVGDKKYLLVLDDVWNEVREKWIELRDLLKIGRTGSKILVTTRSREVAKIMGTVFLRELQGLSEDDSWILFEKMAFDEHGQAEQKQRLMEVGKEILKKCVGVPLAIRMVGSLLYGKDEQKWSSFKDKDLSHISTNGQNAIMDILKLSYQHLWSPLKPCFAYCALFPKGFVIQMRPLIEKWMAEGFIIPNNEGQLLEEIAEDYCLSLLQSSMFQDVEKDKWEYIVSFKMHDLIHDLAQKVAGVNYKVAKSGESNSNKALHLSFDYSLTPEWKIPNWMLDLKLLRTFLLPKQRFDGSPLSKSICQELILRFGCLRVLDLHNLGVESLPSSIGKLIHLRYLNLSYSFIKELTDSVTKLLKLQTLKLRNCRVLRTLPTSIGKLKNLRSLDVYGCAALVNLPSGLGELMSLTNLPLLRVNYEHSSNSSCKPTCAKLSDLKNLNNLRGVMTIKILGMLETPLLEAREANLTGKHKLTHLCIELDECRYEDVGRMDHDEAVLEELKPHRNLRSLHIEFYYGQKLPSWAIRDNLCKKLPNLVKILLYKMERWEEVPCFSQLPFLKFLSLSKLRRVEYMEIESNLYDHSSSSKSPMMGTRFFPSLEQLYLVSIDKLKGWWKGGETANHNTKEASYLLSIPFSKLSILCVYDCPRFKFRPQCPNLVDLRMVNVNESLSASKMATSTSGGSYLNLKKLMISDVEDLISLPRECLHQLSQLWISDNSNLVKTDRLGEVFTDLSSSLRCLKFSECSSLRNISQGLENLTALEELELWNCENLDLSQDEQLPWKIFKSLRSLQISLIPKLVSLPIGLEHLSNLRTLKIESEGLRKLPEWMSSLSDLQYLELSGCSNLTSLPEDFRKLAAEIELAIIKCRGLTERCRRPSGCDWPKIQHLRHVLVYDEDVEE